MTKTKENQNRRVVVTGLGVVSSLGIGWEEFWKNIMAGKSGISKITAFDTSQYERHYAGEVKNFEPTRFIDKRRVARLGRASQMAIAASKLALKDAHINVDQLIKAQTAVCIGTTTGEIHLLEEFNDARQKGSRKIFQKNNISIFPSNSLSGNIAVEFKLQGPNNVFATACASGNYAIGEAFDLIRRGRADCALTGGTDGFSRIVFTGFGRLFAMAPEMCQPFEKNRKGMITGEGAGILFLETWESAKKRKATIYAEILSYGVSCDAQHMTIPSVGGIEKSVSRALNGAQLEASAIDYISAHGTGTVENDSAECQAMKRVFKDQLKRIPMSSIKSMLGHTMGAAAALEAIACCLSIHKQEVPPTINYCERDPECDIDCVPNKGRKHKVKVALNNSQAFGGNNAVLVLRNFDIKS